MKIVLIILLSYYSIMAASSYSNALLRQPVGSYSVALGGISILNQSNSPISNPAIASKYTSVTASVSTLPFNREEATASISSKIKGKLAFNLSYLYRGERGIEIYNVDENIIESENQISNFFNFGLNYVIISSKRKGKLVFGSSVTVAKEYLLTDIESQNPIHGISLGANYRYYNLEVASSLHNLLSNQEWAKVTEKGEEEHKEIVKVTLPLKGLVAVKYTIFDIYSLMAQTDIEDSEDLRYHSLFRGAVSVDLDPLQCDAGYGDERFSLGFGYNLTFGDNILNLHSAVSTEKMDQYRLAFSTNFKF